MPVRAAITNCVNEVALRTGGLPKFSRVGFLPHESSSYHTSSVLHLGRKQRKASGSQFIEKSSRAEGEHSAIVEKVRPRQVLLLTVTVSGFIA